MAKEIYIYESIWSYSALDFMREMEDSKDEDVVIRVNSNGGSPEDGYGMIAKFKEHAKGKSVRIDGKARSMALYFTLFSDDVKALDASELLLHRAAYAPFVERDRELMTDQMWESLNSINGKLRAAVEAKIDEAKLKEIKGVTLDEVFSNDEQLDVIMTAEEAKEIGFINDIIQVTPQMAAEINSRTKRIAAESNGFTFESNSTRPKSKDKNSNKNSDEMNIEKLRADHPDLYKEVFEQGKKAGVTAEKERVNSWLAWQEADAERVAKGIKDGEEITASTANELHVKIAKAGSLKGLENESGQNEPGVQEEKETKELTAEQKAKKDFFAEVDNIKPQ